MSFKNKMPNRILCTTLVSSAAVFLASTPALAQDIRTIGMGGALLPGSSLGQYNPAYSAYPSNQGSSFTLPIGLLNFLLRPQLNPLTLLNSSAADLTDPKKGFDFLGFYDQVSNINTLIFNPASSPTSVSFDVAGNTFGLRDQNGKPINLSNLGSSSRGSTADVTSTSGNSNLFSIPFSIGPLTFGIGLSAGASGPSFTPDSALKSVLTNVGFSPNTVYSINSSARASTAVNITVGFAAPIEISESESVPAFTVYVGAKGTGFVGLAYLNADVTGSIKTGADSKPDTATIDGNGTVFISSLVTGGFGYGANLDLGVAADVQGFTLGLGVIGATNISSWKGSTYTVAKNSGGSIALSSPTPETRSHFSFNPLVTFNTAYTFSPDGFPGTLLLVADTQFGRGAFAAHAGVEAGFAGLLFARTGVGYENGLRFGLGGSVMFIPSLGLDVALTSHTAPITNQLDFGIAMALRFGF